MARHIRGENSPSDPEFLTIDLDVRSRRTLAELWTAWPSAARPLKDDGREHDKWLILRPDYNGNKIEAAAKQLLRSIKRLPPAAQACWNQATRRTFDIGISGGISRKVFEGLLSTETLKGIAEVGGVVQVTVYPPREVMEGNL